MTLSGYFISKSVFGQQSCRALTFALARLSCYFNINVFYLHGRYEHYVRMTLDIAGVLISASNWHVYLIPAAFLALVVCALITGILLLIGRAKGRITAIVNIL